MLWVIESKVSCNLRLYPEYIKSILENWGKGLEKAHVYSGLLTHLEISLSACYYAYFAYLLGGLIRMIGYKIRPYEINKGDTDRVLKETVGILEGGISWKNPMDKAVSEVISMFDRIPGMKGTDQKLHYLATFMFVIMI